VPRKATGSAYERGGKLYAYVTLPGGKRKPFPCPDKIRTLKQAKDYSAWLNEQIRLGSINPDALAAKPAEPLDKAATFEGWCGKWLDERRARNLASVDDDESRLRVHVWPVLGALPVAQVTTADLERLVGVLDAKIHAGKMSWKTARNVWGAVTKAFVDARRSKNAALRVRQDNPAADVAPPDAGATKAKVYLWPSEVARLLACDRVPVRWKRLVVLSVYLYCRAGELEALQWDAVDLEHGVIHVHQSVERYREIGKIKPTKGRMARRYPIEPALVPLLAAMRAEAGGAKATGAVVKMPPAEDLAERLRQYLEWAGVTRTELFALVADKTRKRITWHDLRATGITWRAVRGDDPLKIQAAAGHADFPTTLGYIREAEALRAGFGQVFDPVPAALLVAPD